MIGRSASRSAGDPLSQYFLTGSQSCLRPSSYADHQRVDALGALECEPKPDRRTVVHDVKRIARDDEYLPIPQDQVNLSCGVYVQNPGY